MDALLNRRGQYIPMIFAFIVSFVLLMMVVSDIYKVTRAKLQAQNIADAVALAVATLQARGVNAPVDRNEWMNHMYPDDVMNGPNPSNNCNRLPPISMVGKGPWQGCTFDKDLQKATAYAQLVNTVNQAQQMFTAAYNQFLGAGQATSSQNSGPGSLADILAEIDGLNNDPSSPVRVMVYNNTMGQSAADGQAQQIVQQGVSQFAATSQISTPGQMAPLKFKTEDVTLKLSDGSTTNLTKLIYGNNPPAGPDGDPIKVGWMHPDWSDQNSSLQVNVKQGQPETTIGAGAIVVKMVHLPGPILKDVFVQAKSVAYVVKTSGLDTDPNSPDPTKPLPPTHFRPTYYVQLGYR